MESDKESEKFHEFTCSQIWNFKTSRLGIQFYVVGLFILKGRITTSRVIREGGGSLLRYYSFSFFNGTKISMRFLTAALKTIYPEYKWTREWFPNICTFPRSYWNEFHNWRAFFESISDQYNVINATDWKRISTALIVNKGFLNFQFKWQVVTSYFNYIKILLREL